MWFSEKMTPMSACSRKPRTFIVWLSIFEIFRARGSAFERDAICLRQSNILRYRTTIIIHVCHKQCSTGLHTKRCGVWERYELEKRLLQLWNLHRLINAVCVSLSVDVRWMQVWRSTHVESIPYTRCSIVCLAVSIDQTCVISFFPRELVGSSVRLGKLRLPTVPVDDWPPSRSEKYETQTHITAHSEILFEYQNNLSAASSPDKLLSKTLVNPRC